MKPILSKLLDRIEVNEKDEKKRINKNEKPKLGENRRNMLFGKVKKEEDFVVGEARGISTQNLSILKQISSENSRVNTEESGETKGGLLFNAIPEESSHDSSNSLESQSPTGIAKERVPKNKRSLSRNNLISPEPDSKLETRAGT